MNTMGVAASSARAHTYIPLYTYIMLCYTYIVYNVCIDLQSAFVRTTQLFNSIMHTVILLKTSCIYIHFRKWVISNHGSSTQATCRCGRVSQFLAGWSACPSLISCKLLVGAFGFIVGVVHPFARPLATGSNVSYTRRAPKKGAAAPLYQN